MLLKKETQDLQQELANYCRTGRGIPALTLAQRVPEYRRLIFNILWDTLETAYPICYKDLNKSQWKTLVHDFFSAYPNANPQVWRMPQELIFFLEAASDYPLLIEKPYLLDLLRFEWSEIEVFSMEDIDVCFDANVDWDKELVLNPHHEVLHLNYPVFEKIQQPMSDRIGNYFLLISRNLNTDKVSFYSLSVFSVLLFMELQEGESKLKLALHNVVTQQNLEYNEGLYNEARTVVEDWVKKGIVLGVKS